MKKSRHQKIKELIEQFEIETQEELADKLREAGYPGHSFQRYQRTEAVKDTYG